MATKKDEAKIKFTAETSEFQAEVKKAGDEITSLGKELRLNAAEMKNTGETTRLLKQRHELLKNELEASRTKTKNLNAQLESAKKIYGEDSEAVRKLNNQITSSKTIEQKIQTELDQTNEKLKTNAKNYGLTAEKAEKLNKVLDKTGQLSGATVAGVAAVATGAVASFNAVDDGADQVIRKTGATGDAAQKLEETYKDVAKNIVGDFSNIGDAVGEVNTKFRLEGEELQKTTEKYLKFANVNEVDVVSSIDSAYQASQKWNLSNEDTLLLLDHITKKGQDTGIAIDTIFQGINDNSSILQEMGFTLAQSVEYIADLEVSGINATDGFKAMKMAIKNATAEGISLNSFLEKNVIDIKNAKTETEALSIATDTFGTKNAPEMTKAIRDGRLTLDGFTKSAEEFGGTVENTFESTLDGGEKLNLAMQNIKIAAGEIGAEVLEELQPQIDGFVESAKDAADWAKDNGAEIVSAMKTVGAVAGTVFSVNKIAKFVGSVGTLKGAISGAISGVKALAVARAAETVAVEAETVATEGLTIAQMATPWGLIAGLVGGLTVGLLACAIATKDNTSNLWKEDEATRALIDSTDKLVQEHENLQEEIKRNKEARDENIESAESENVQVDILWKKLKELNGVQKKTNAQKETMKSLVESLNELMPELNLKYDAEKDALNKSTKAIEKNIEAQKNLILAKAAQKNAEGVAGDIADAEIKSEELAEQKEKNKKELDKATKERKAAEKAWRETDRYDPNLTDRYNDYQKALAREKELQKAYDDTSNAIKENQKTIDGLYSEYDKFTNYAENLFDKNEIEEKLNALTKKAKKAGVEIPKSISEGIESGKYAVPKSIKQLNALIKYEDIIDKAEKAGIKIPKSVVNGIKSGELKPSEAVERMNRWIDFKKAIEEAGLSGEKIPKKMRNGILSGTTSVESAISELKSKAVSKISGNGKEFKNQGKSDAQSYATGLKNGMPSKIYAAITPKIVLETVGNSGSVKIQKNAVGNIVEKPILTTFAEEGPEAAIPINTSLRSRMLWLETGRRMGLLNKRKIISNYSNMATADIQSKVDMAETNVLLRVIANKDFNTYLNGKKVSEGIASSLDSVNGNRLMLAGRGCAYE